MLTLKDLSPEAKRLLGAAMPEFSPFTREHRYCSPFRGVCSIRFSKKRVYCEECENARDENVCAALPLFGSARAIVERVRRGKPFKRRHRAKAKQQLEKRLVELAPAPRN